MKTSSSSVTIGLYVFGAVVGLYLIGAAFLLMDALYFKTFWFFTNAPEPIGRTVEAIYRPIDYLLRLLFGEPP